MNYERRLNQDDKEICSDKDTAISIIIHKDYLIRISSARKVTKMVYLF